MNLLRALASGEGLNIHIHHHHWHHSDQPDDDLANIPDQLKSRTMETKGEIATDKPIAELPDGPAPAPCELPTDCPSNENPPSIQPKPVFRLVVTEYVD